MSEIWSIGRVMTPFPHAIDLEQPLSEARALMSGHGVRHLPVTHSGALFGVLSERDIDLAVGPDPIPPAQDRPVRTLATPDPYTVDFHAPLDAALLEMAERHIGSALVTRKGKLVGIFTASDACRVFGEYLRDRRPPDDDAA